MILKILSVLFLLLAAALAFVLAYSLYPSEAVELLIESSSSEPTITINYGATPVFIENLRFSDSNLSFFIEPSCSQTRERSMREAFSIFEQEFSIISFYESTRSKADIFVGCSDDYIELGENLFTAGEGGPSEIINTSYFKVIRRGKISLFKDQQCDSPIVELHELGHVFGFDHSRNPKSIMYNVSRCDQRITSDMVTLIEDLYSIDSLPDAVIEDISAVKHGKRLDFNITINNVGLADIINLSLTLSSNGKEIDVIYLDDIGIGYGRTLSATNVLLHSRSIEEVDFTLDVNNIIPEINEENNFARMRVSS